MLFHYSYISKLYLSLHFKEQEKKSSLREIMRVEMAMSSMKKKCFIFALVLSLIMDVGFGGGIFVAEL